MCSKLVTRRPGRTPRPAHRFVPRLVPLEDRLAPATYAVTTVADTVDPADGKRSFREAVLAANAHPNSANPGGAPDVIVLPAGVYKIARPFDPSNPNAGGVFRVFESVTVKGQGAGVTAIDGQRLDRLFDLLGDMSVAFAGVTLRNGGDNPVTGNGGAIQALTADVRLTDCVVTGNFGIEGGGINAVSGDVALVRTTVSRNAAQTIGGGLRVGGTLTMQASTVRRNVAGEDGGGILAATANLTGSTVSDNRARNGGGLAGTTIRLTRSTVSGNVATTGSGGGIFNASDGGTVTLTASTVRGNIANFQDAGGGGLYAGNGTATLTGTTVTGNIAHFGGGLFAFEAGLTNCAVSGNSAGRDGGGVLTIFRATLKDSTVSANFADRDGGGLYALEAGLTNCTVSDNFARSGDGGGLNVRGVRLIGSTVSGNIAGGSGGGINASGVYLANTTVAANFAGLGGGGILASEGTLLHVTIAENIASDGGGIFRVASFEGLSVANTLIARNLVRVGGTGPDVNGDFTSLGHNLIGDGSGSDDFTGAGDQVGTAANPIDPKLGPLRNNGGRTQTHALLAGSPAIDKGDNAAATSAGLTTDQRGSARRKDSDGNGTGVVDIGAFER
jgi:hypothetical protein